MKEIKMERSDIKTLDDEAKADYDEWNLKFPNCARFSLITHVESISDPSRQYYGKLFSTDGGHSYNLQWAAKCCKIFDPLLLKGKENYLPRLFVLADELKNFGFTKITDNFIENLKREIKIAVREENKPFDSYCINDTIQYKTRIVKRKNRYNLDDDHDFNWKMIHAKRLVRFGNGEEQVF